VHDAPYDGDAPHDGCDGDALHGDGAHDARDGAPHDGHGAGYDGDVHDVHVCAHDALSPYANVLSHLTCSRWLMGQAPSATCDVDFPHPIS